MNAAPAVDLGRLAEVVARFAVPGRLLTARRQAGGHIHDSYKVVVREPGCDRAYLLQTMNDHVFPDPPAVMANVEAVTRHLRQALAREAVPDAERRVLMLVPPTSGAACLTDERGQWWRLFHFIEGSASVTVVKDAAGAAAAGAAYGAFTRRLADWDAPRLLETIPRFHDTRWRMQQLDQAISVDRVSRVESCADEIAFARERAALADVLPALSDAGELPERIAHNDAKPANVLFDVVTGEGLCVIDLDTVMPGSALHDFGDMLRSMTSTTGEDRTAESGVDVDAELLAGLARGYLSEAGELLTDAEREHLVVAGEVITFEQGLRFLTDHLDGDRYFRTQRSGHNLRRARNQFALARAFGARRSDLERLLASL